MNPDVAVKWIWIVFGVFWLLAAFAQKRSVRRQSMRSRLLQVAIVLLALTPFYLGGSRFGILYRRFLPSTPGIQDFGLLLMAVGLGFAVWARVTLGRNWSGTVTVKENHVLMTRGPYAWVRHPIYTGFLLSLLGTALVGGIFANLLAVAVVALALWLKLRTEENFMVETFGEQYITYRKRVKALVPYVI
jgi:protein-S-isoprenylcysteine O-methyltransferase Ste14